MSLDNKAPNKIYKIIRGKLTELNAEGDYNNDINSKEYCVKKLEEKSILELKDLLNRQKNILENKNFISKLPDKGAKLKAKYVQIENALHQATKCNLNENNSDINDIEWTKDPKNIKKKNTLNSTCNALESHDDEFRNPLELLASHSETVPRRRKINRDIDDDPSESIVKELKALDIADDNIKYKNNVIQSHEGINGGSNNVTQLHEGINGGSDYLLKFNMKLMNNLELKEKSRSNNIKKPFKPFRSLKHDKGVKPKDPKTNLLWMESAATGPLNYANSKPAKVLPIEESLHLLGEAQKKERDILLKGAARDLSKCSEMKIGLPASNYLSYRDTNLEHHILEDSDEEDYNGARSSYEDLNDYQ